MKITLEEARQWALMTGKNSLFVGGHKIVIGTFTNRTDDLVIGGEAEVGTHYVGVTTSPGTYNRIHGFTGNVAQVYLSKDINKICDKANELYVELILTGEVAAHSTYRFL